MRIDIALGEPVPAESMRTIERTLQLQHCKWDTHVGDVNVLSPQPFLIAEREWAWLSMKAEHAAQEIVSEQPGQASVAFTLEVYSHVDPHIQDTAAMKVEALLMAE
ncbi:MAG TPA: hypothetical protein VI320_13860 [Terracidiphilus sp.]|jgi:hypothetical protein